MASKYISYLQTTEIDISEAKEDEILIKRNGKLHRPTRLPSGLYQFREGTQHERVVLDCHIATNGAGMIWIETPTQMWRALQDLSMTSKTSTRCQIGVQQFTIV